MVSLKARALLTKPLSGQYYCCFLLVFTVIHSHREREMGEECINASKRRKIHDTVLQILKASDLETITELEVRSAAAVRLGFDLSGLNHRLLVGQLVNSFLLSKAAEILRTNTLNKTITDAGGNCGSADYHVGERRQRSDVDAATGAKYDGKIICKLSDNRRVTVHDFRGATVVSIRDFCAQSGNLLPVRDESSGISLTSRQWSSFRNSVPSIEEAIVRLESRLRSGAVTRQSEAEIASSDSACEKNRSETGVSNLASSIQLPGKRKRNQSDQFTRSPAADPSEESTQATTSNLVNVIKSEQTEIETSMEKAEQMPVINGTTATSSYQKQVPASITEVTPENSTVVPPLPNQIDGVTALSHEKLNHTRCEQTGIGVSEQLIPIQPIRFDGRNYHSWRSRMEMFLNQLSIAYVLNGQCPSISLNPEASIQDKVGAKAAIERWITDDHVCRHHILSSLCDGLFQLYLQKSLSAGELWEELKAVYNDDFGTKRSQINKYIHFQMVDGVSIFEQVQELHNLADSIINSGIWIEENFHVSVIVSKLPPSWKELRLKLMQEEFLNLNMLMYRLRVEADRKETNSKRDHVSEPKLDQRQRTKKDETKRACFTCGEEGHIRNNCPLRKFEPGHKSNNGKENGFQWTRTGAKMDDADKRARFTRARPGHISNNCRDKKSDPIEKYTFLSPNIGSETDDAAKTK